MGGRRVETGCGSRPWWATPPRRPSTRVEAVQTWALPPPHGARPDPRGVEAAELVGVGDAHRARGPRDRLGVDLALLAAHREDPGAHGDRRLGLRHGLADLARREAARAFGEGSRVTAAGHGDIVSNRRSSQ